MARGDRADEPDETDDAPMLDLSQVPASRLRDRLDAHRDGREERVVAAASDLRASLDRLAAGIAYRRQAMTTRAGELARAAAPFAGGLAAAGVGVAVLLRGRANRGSRVGGESRVVYPGRAGHGRRA